MTISLKYQREMGETAFHSVTRLFSTYSLNGDLNPLGVVMEDKRRATTRMRDDNRDLYKMKRGTQRFSLSFLLSFLSFLTFSHFFSLFYRVFKKQLSVSISVCPFFPFFFLFFPLNLYL